MTGVATMRSEIKADKVVLATGAAQGVVQRIAGIEIPQRSTPGIHLHQRQDGRLVIGEQSEAPSNKAQTKRLQARPKLFPDYKFSQQHAGRMIEIAAQFLPAIKRAKVEQV